MLVITRTVDTALVIGDELDEVYIDILEVDGDTVVFQVDVPEGVEILKAKMIGKD